MQVLKDMREGERGGERKEGREGERAMGRDSHISLVNIIIP